MQNRYYSTSEKILHAKHYALYFIPPLVMNFCSYHDVYGSSDESQLANWWTYLLANPLPPHHCFKDLIAPSVVSATSILV